MYHNLEDNCKLIKCFLNNKNGVEIDIISESLNIDYIYLKKLLENWEKNWNTYFYFGRIFCIENKETLTKKWYWLSNQHFLARHQNLANLILTFKD